MYPEIAAFVRERQLSADLVGPLHALFARLQGGNETVRQESHPPGAPTVFLEPGAAMSRERLFGIPAGYQDLGPIGLGGMGEVRRVRDEKLGRTCALKVIRSHLAGVPQVVARFVEEAQIAGQLQHPNIPPVYDAGRLDDGRAWFTMKEVRGGTLADLIAELHHDAPTAAGLRRLIDVFATACDAVGYAHARGVVHRDLKPENVMVGAHGEVLVLDWGLAKIVGAAEGTGPDAEPAVSSTRSADDTQRTRVGGVMGTPAYMPPEQARGAVAELGPWSDVYALGATLYEILGGVRPYAGLDAQATLRAVLDGPPAALDADVPEELLALCAACLARDPAARPADASRVAAGAREWLDGAGKREKALQVVAAADAIVAETADLRRRSAMLRAAGAAALADVAPWAPEDAKVDGWALQDEADRVERGAALLELRREALLRGALTHAPELTEAHAALCELELARHRAAEAARDEHGAARAEIRLREHLEALPAAHVVRRGATRWLTGDGALTIHADTPGTRVELLRYEVRDRRLVPVPIADLGMAPIDRHPLPMGSYLCRLSHPERDDVACPILIGRGEHADGVAPGERDPTPVRMPPRGALGRDDCLVPAGWFWSGGDGEAVDSLPRRRLWCDAVIVRRFPVTNREFLAFLDDLVASGREADAERFQPRERTSDDAAPIYGRDEAGRFVLRPDADGDRWEPDWPVVLVDWFAASAYAAWEAARTGAPWRLPAELEWEKAARGVDGRFHPWGDGFDPSRCCMRQSHPGRPLPAPVDSFPVDCSVYGVRGLAGGVEDWCGDVYQREGPALDGVRVVPPVPGDPAAARNVRGGNWVGSARYARSAYRYRYVPGARYGSLGFRLARSVTG